MPGISISLRALLLSALLSTAVSGVTIPSIFERESTCAAAGLSSCPAGVPGDFCCKKGQTCIALAGNTTILCCPEGECPKIKPIQCDISLQDTAKHPESSVKTTFLTGKLPSCGPACCPFGYTCNNNSECVIDEDQTAAPIGAPKPSPSVAPTSTATSTPTPSLATPIPQAPSAGPEQKTGENGGSGGAFPTTAVIVGVLVGVLGGVAVMIVAIVVIARRRRNKRQNEKKLHRTGGSSTSSFGNIISDPIMTGDHPPLRSDFILKTPNSQTSKVAPSSATHATSRLSGMFGGGRDSVISQGNSPSYSNHPSAERVQVAGAAVPPIRGMRKAYTPGQQRAPPPPVTPRLQREPSSESINVFADPRTVGRDGRNDSHRFTQATTFTDMMREADLGDVARGRPYVPGSAGNTPRR
jgi:hypothetical protein